MAAPQGSPAGAARRECRVSRVETFLVGTAWRNLVFCRVETDDGLHGWGEGSLEWQPRAVEAAIRQLAERWVIGQSAFGIERLWQAMFRNEFARGGPVVNSAIGAIEMALWDIVGRALERPVYDLLGGRCCERIDAYANAWYQEAEDSLEALGRAARAVAEKGYRGLKLDPFGDAGRDPGHRAVRAAAERVAVVREAVGPDVEILIDCHGRFSPGSAIEIARALEPSRIYWFEEPCDPENVGALQQVGRHIRTRLATGERCYTKYHLQALLAGNTVSVLQPDVIHIGGILEGKKVAAMADAHYLPVSFHNPFGPVATAAAIQLDACCTNIVMQESFCEYDVPWRRELFTHGPWPERGGYAVPEAPGLGIELDAEALRAHPYRADAFLPMWSGGWARGFQD